MSRAVARGRRTLATVARLRRRGWLEAGREAAVRLEERRGSEGEAGASADRAARLRADARSLARAGEPDGGTSSGRALAASALERRRTHAAALREEGRAGRLRALAGQAEHRALAAAARAAGERERYAAVRRAVSRLEGEEARSREAALEREAEEAWGAGLAG